MRVTVWPASLLLAFLRRFDAYARGGVISLRRPCREREHLRVFELCDGWQLQHHPIRLAHSYLR